MRTQEDKGRAFQALHERAGAFIIPNPWVPVDEALLVNGREAGPVASAGNPPSRIDSLQTLLDTTARARWGASCPRQGSLLPPTFVSG